MAANLRTWLQEWGGQPDGVASPVQDGPFSAPALLWNAATPRINLANGVTPTGDGTGVSERAGPYGKEADFSGSGTGRYIFATAPEQDAVTIAIEAQVDSTTDLDRLVSAYNGAGSGKYDIFVDSTQLWVFQVLRATTNGQFRFSAGLSATFRGTLVISHTLDATPKAYFNGNALSVSVLSAGSGATVASSNLLGIGGRPDVTTRQLDGGISTVWRLDRALPASAAQMLSQPGALSRLLYEPQRIWVPVSAGGGINASVTLTGCSAASAAGTTVALGSATVTLSGASSAASAGTVTASAGSSATVTLSGTSSASAAGSLLATAGATAVLSGTSSASAAGAVAASAGASVTVVGSAASSAAGALTATAGGNAVATLTGASATSTAGSLTAGGSAGISLAGVGAAGAAGAVTATAGGAASVTLTGASASAAAGILAGFGGAQITLTGASASGAAGSASASAGSGSGTGATAAEIWSYTLSSGLTADATLVAIHTMLSELHLIHGLTAGSPLSVTVASRAAGAVSQAVAEAAGTVTVTRQ